MHPHLFTVGTVTITSFGLMMFVAFLAGAWTFGRQLARRGIRADVAWDMLLWIALGGIVGAKLYYVVLHPTALLADPLRELTSRAGLVWYGGLIGGGLAFLWQVRRRSLPLADTFDAASPAVILGYAIGRVGCFLVGDDYGRPTDAWMGVAFPDGYPPSTAGYFRSIGTQIPAQIPDTAVLAVHPTQLYEAALALGIFAVLWRLSGRLRPGRLFAAYLGLYGTERFLIEFVRAKTDLVPGGFTTSQVVSVVLLLLAGAIWARTAAKPAGSAVPVPSRFPVLLLSAWLVAAAFPAAGVAQEPRDTALATPTPPRDTAAVQAPRRAAYVPPKVAVSLMVAPAGFDRLQVQPVVAQRLDSAGGVVQSFPLSRTIRAGDGFQVVGSVLYSLGPAWALRAGAGFGVVSLSDAYSSGSEEGESADIAEEARSLAVDVEPGLRWTTWEAALRFRIPSTRRVQPYAELGVAGQSWEAEAAPDTTFPGAEALRDPAGRLAAHAAFGALIPLGERFAVRVQATAVRFRTPLVPAPEGGAVATGDSLAVVFAAPATAPFADPAIELATALRLELGLSAGFGRALPRSGARSGSGGSSSGTRR